MAATATQVILDTPAAEFRLPATDGKTYALDDVAGEKGTVVVFICNHCPYVKAVIDRMVADARVLMSEGVGFAAICSNDAASYPEDSFENMKRFAKAHDFPFPYLHDETQSVARAFGAVCTPDFFGYNADRKLKYRGRLDEGRTTPPRAGAPRDAQGSDGVKPEGIRAGGDRRRTSTASLRHRERDLRAVNGRAHEARANLSDHLRHRLPLFRFWPSRRPAEARIVGRRSRCHWP